MLPVYKWKKPRQSPAAEARNRAQATTDQELLTGTVRGVEASDHEERFALALDKAELGFEFQPSYVAQRNLPGEIRLDFMVWGQGGSPQPVQVDGAFTHKTASQKEEDKVKDAVLDEALTDMGAMPTLRVPGIPYLESQEAADAYVEEHLL